MAGVAATTGIIYAIHAGSGMSNLALFYLPAVIAVAVRFGRGAAIASAVLSFLAYSYFFVPPVFAFAVHDAGDLLTLCMFLLTASSMGRLTSLLQLRAGEMQRREREAAALAATSCAVSSQLNLRDSLTEVLRQVASVAPVTSAAVLIPDASSAERVAAEWLGGAERALADEDPDSLLLSASDGKALGRLVIRRGDDGAWTSASLTTVRSLANLAAVALERDRLIRGEAEIQALQETDRLKTALLTMVSHDFRSPLASIKASAEAYLQNPAAWDRATLQSLHLGVLREADRLNGLIENLLTMSRLDAGAWQPVCEWTSLWECVESARGWLTDSQNSRVQVSFWPDLPDVWLDHAQMGQVLRNLLENALKYSPPGSPVELSAGVFGDHITIDVMDRGPGLPPGSEDQLFERFYRAPRFRDSTIPGAGLGLSVCRGLVSAHHGIIRAFNREGGGAVFQIRLPYRHDHQTATDYR